MYIKNMEEILTKVQKIVERDCKLGIAPDWFYETHILAVKKYADFLLTFSFGTVARSK